MANEFNDARTVPVPGTERTPSIPADRGPTYLVPGPNGTGSLDISGGAVPMSSNYHFGMSKEPNFTPAELPDAPDNVPGSTPITDKPASKAVFLTPEGGDGAGGMDALTMAMLAPGRTVSRAAHEERLVSPERQAAGQAALDSIGKAERAANAAEAQGYANKAAATQRVSEAQAQQGKDTSARAQQSQAKSDEYLDKMNRFSAALANEEIDPDRMWHNASTVTKVRWTLARMLGAVQQGALHLPSNQIAEQLDAMARADVDAQKANYEHKRGRLNDMRNMYSMAMEQTRNRDEAERLAHGYAITALQTQVQTVAEASQSDIVKAQAAKLDAELELRKVDRGNHENRWVPTQTSEAPNAFGLTAKDRSELLKHALTKQIDANAKHKDDKSDIQATITEQNKQFDNILNSDVLKKTGWLTGIANSTGFQRLMPESSQNAVAVDGINQQVLGSVGKQLKDSEGRIAPPVLEALHKLAVNPYDTEAVARKKVQMAKDFVNSVALQSGALVAIRPFEHVEDFTKAGVTLPGIAARAEGGPVAQGQPVLVGERGPEMVLPMGTPVAAPAPFDVGPEVPLYTQDGKRLNGRPDGVTTRERPAPAAAADIELTDEDSLPVYGANGKQLQERPLQDDRKGVPMSVPAQERLNRTRAAAARWAEPFRKTAPYRGDVEALSQPDHHEEIRKTILAAQRTRSSIKRRRSSSARPGPSS